MEFYGIHGIPDTVMYKESERGNKNCSFAKHHDLLVFFSVFKWTGILTYVMTPIFKNYILKFGAWLGFSMKKGHRQAPKSVFMILSATAVKLHLTRKSAVSLQWRSKSWKLAWEPVEISVWRCFCFHWRISVSKMGSSVQNYWKNHRNIQNREKISKNRVKKKLGIFSAEKKSLFLSSPGCVPLLWASPKWKNKEKMNFIYKKSIFLRFLRNFFGGDFYGFF